MSRLLPAPTSSVSIPERTHQNVATPRRPSSSGLELSAILRTLARNKWLLLPVSLCGALLGLLLSLLITPRYKATSTIQILNQSSDLSGSRLSGFTDQNSDPLDFNMSMQTQINVLNSDTLALEVIQQLGLRGTRDYRYRPSFAAKRASSPSRSGEMSADERSWLVERLHRRLSVSSIPGTRVIQIDFTSPDPALAAAIPNKLLADFQSYNYKMRYETALGPSGALATELEALRKKIVEEDALAADLQKQAGTYGADNYSVVVTRLQAVNRLYLDAEANATLKKAVYDATRTGDPELISALVGPGGSAPLQGGGLTLIESLRGQEAQVNAEYAQLRERYGENYPKLAEIKERLNSLARSISTEVKKLSDRAYTDYAIAAKQQAKEREELASQTSLANSAADLSTRYSMLKGEADSDRKLYLNLSEKLDQAKLVAGLQSSNFATIDPARIPAVPSSPKRLLMAGVGLIVGLFLGASFCLLRDRRGERLRDVEDAELLSGMPLLGLIPRFSQKTLLEEDGLIFNGLRSVSDGNSISVFAAEAYRTVRTAILLSRPSGSRAMTCLITSAAKGDGKTTTAINLAMAFAKLNGRTLLIDADMRNGAVGGRLKLREREGLAEALHSGFQSTIVQHAQGAEHLDVLVAGTTPENPSELLTSSAFQQMLSELQAEYDYIFLDTPPTAMFTDAVVLASYVDFYLFVVRPGHTTIPAFSQSLIRMNQTSAQPLGILFNGMEPDSAQYAEYGGLLPGVNAA